MFHIFFFLVKGTVCFYKKVPSQKGEGKSKKKGPLDYGQIGQWPAQVPGQIGQWQTQDK